MKTFVTKPSDIKREWHVLDAADQVLGRLATEAAKLLMGKHKPIFVRNTDTGDYVVIINAEKVKITGNKPKQKMYYRHSGYPGSLKSETYEKVVKRKPVFPIEHAIRGMLPKGRLGRKLFNNVKVYADGRHPQLRREQPEFLHGTDGQLRERRQRI